MSIATLSFERWQKLLRRRFDDPELLDLVQGTGRFAGRIITDF